MAVRAQRGHRVEIERDLELPAGVDRRRVAGAAALVVLREAAVRRCARREAELGTVCSQVGLGVRVVVRVDDRDRLAGPGVLRQVGEVVRLLQVRGRSGLGSSGRRHGRSGCVAVPGARAREPVDGRWFPQPGVHESAGSPHAEDLSQACRASCGRRRARGDWRDARGVREARRGVGDARGRRRGRGADRGKEQAGERQERGRQQPRHGALARSSERAPAGPSRTRRPEGSEDAGGNPSHSSRTGLESPLLLSAGLRKT